VKNFDSNLAVSKILSHRFATGLFLRGFLALVFSASLFGAAVAAAGVSHWPSASFGAYQSFSVADFDEDSKPDLASIQPGNSNGRSTDYWVDLQLSAGGRQTFRVVAPLGNVQIASRDVNGDNVPDLVLTRIWTAQPVAILLNDGHGTFSKVDPEAFPEAFRECRATWRSKADHKTDVVGIPSQSRDDLSSETGSYLFLRPGSRVVYSSDSRLTFLLFLISHSSRAPPFEAFHS